MAEIMESALQRFWLLPILFAVQRRASSLLGLLPGFLPVSNVPPGVGGINDRASGEAEAILFTFCAVPLEWKHVLIRLAAGEVRSLHLQHIEDSGI